MVTPLPVAKWLLVLAATLFAIAVAEGILIVHAVIALLLAGQVYAASSRG